MQTDTKILFIGDIVGKSGRNTVKKYLSDCNNVSDYNFIIANAENASHGFGLTNKNHDELISYGINCLTSGNHIWDKKDIFNYINSSEYLIRPYNYHKSALGVGYRIYNDKIVVINLLGKTFMPPIACPFIAIEEIINKLKEENQFENKIIIVDFHAEATAEKECFAKYASELGVNCIIGTHTHVQTADEQILNNKCGYITDVGFCGSTNGVIGMEYPTSLRRILTSINERFEVENEPPFIFNACEIKYNNNQIININRIQVKYESLECNNEA